MDKGLRAAFQKYIKDSESTGQHLGARETLWFPQETASASKGKYITGKCIRILDNYVAMSMHNRCHPQIAKGTRYPSQPLLIASLLGLESSRRHTYRGVCEGVSREA